MQVHRHGGVVGQAGQRVAQPAVAEDGGVESVREVAQVGQARMQLGEHGAELGAGSLRQVAVGREPELQLQRDRHEPLLGAVVEVALDLAACPVGRLDDARARRAHLGELRLDDLVLAQRLLGGAAGGDVEDRTIEPAPAVARLLCLTAFEDPALVAVAVQDAVLQRVRAPSVDRVEDRVLDLVTVVGVDRRSRRSAPRSR